VWLDTIDTNNDK